MTADDVDYYDVIGVARTASAREIKRAFRKRARELHPDLNPTDPDAERLFKQLAEAYEVLSDPARRQRYDETGHTRRHEGPPPLDREFTPAFRAAWEQVVTLFFDAVLPRYLARYQRGRGCLLVHRLVHDLEHLTLLDVMDGDKPGFADRDQAGRIGRACRLRIDTGLVTDNGQPVFGRMLRIRLPGLRWSEVDIYPASFWAAGLNDPDDIALELLKTLAREYARYLEEHLPERLRAVERFEEGQPRMSLDEARRVDDWWVAGRVVQWLATAALVVLVVWLIWNGAFSWGWGVF